MQSIEKIVIIGSGSLATNLALALHNSGIRILQIVSKTIFNAVLLADKVMSTATDKLSGIDLNADLYIIAVTDSSIKEISEKLRLEGKFVVHTAGSIEMEVLQSISENYGVFYPLQTFTKSETIAFNGIPICIEANSKINESLLLQLANKISGNVQKTNSGQRKILHISAVFACNFSNFMQLIANEILSENKLSFEMLKPLILRTAEKVLTQQPENALTGPARRNDVAVMQEHIELLKNHPQYLEIYKLISNEIVKHFHQ